MDYFFIEMTDTYGGESNYSWVNRFIVKANTMRGAMCKVSRGVGCHTRKVMDCGDFRRYDVIGACICFFVNYVDDVEDLCTMYKVKEL